MEPLSVLVSSSPIPSHPSTRIVSETIHSIRWHFKDAPIYLMCDGVRPEQEHRREDYHKYKENLITKMLDEKEEKYRDNTLKSSKQEELMIKSDAHIEQTKSVD